MEPLACSLRCIRRLPLQPGDTVLIVGFGSIGMLLFSLLERIPTRVLTLDLSDDRLQRARALGIRAISPKDDIKKVVAEETDKLGVDVVIFTAGTPETLAKSFDWVRDGGTLALFAELSGEEPAQLDHRDIYKREITVLSSYSPGPKDLHDSFQLIATGAVNLDPQEVLCFSLPEIPRAIHSVLDRRILKAAITPHEE
jgi:L-iditol 2-dehydrogenase